MSDLMDCSFENIIKQVNLINSSSLSDEVKLRRSGELFYQGSQTLLLQAEKILEAARAQEVEESDSKVDSSFSLFLASLTQQSISTNFLQKYLKPQPRATYERESMIKIEFLTSDEASELLSTSLESEIISLAYDEDINVWVDRVANFLEINPSINTLPQIVKATGLSDAQVFISLLFGGFELVQSGEFYDGFEINVNYPPLINSPAVR